MKRTLLFILLFIPLSSYADDGENSTLGTIVITAGGIEKLLSDVSESVEIVTKKDIEEKQAVTVDEVLRGVSGVNINNGAAVDPWLWVSIRGSNADQVLFLVDGVEINNPYTYITAPSTILTESIERIEVLKGSHSALYGSEAIGGVINIITREGKEKPETNLSVKGGDYGTWAGSFFHAAKKGDTPYSIGYSGYNTDSTESLGRFSGNTISGRVKYRVGEYSSLNINSFYRDYSRKGGIACCGFDSGGAWLQLMVPDKSVSKERDWLNSIQFTQYPSAKWDYNIRYSRSDFKTTKDLMGDSALVSPLNIDSEARGSRDIVEARANFYVYESNILTVGAQYREEKLSTSEFSNTDSFGTAPPHNQPSLDESRNSRAVYIQNLLTLKKRATLSAGARLEKGYGDENETLPRLSASYRFASTGTKIKAAYGEGIKAPTLQQLFDPLQGNRDLNSERSESYEMTIEQTLDRFRIEVTAFRIDLKDLISWSEDPANIIFHNIGKAWTKGIETEMQGRDVLRGLDLRIAHTYLESKNEVSGKPLRFRPKNRLIVDARYRGIDKFTLATNVECVGSSYNPYFFLKDIDGNPISDRNRPYRVVNLALSYLVPHSSFDKLELELKVNNLFDENYMEVTGIKAQGINFLAGIRVGF